MPSRFQEIVNSLVEEHGLDLLQQNYSSLHIHSDHPGFLAISVYGFHELYIACFYQEEHNSLIAAPGVLLQVRGDEWTVLEIHQIPGENVVEKFQNDQLTALNRRPILNREAMEAFLDEFAHVMLTYWLSVPHTATLETALPSSTDIEPDDTASLPY
jgi:hypothetical protein